MKWFTITELTRSATAHKKGIDNTPTVEHLDNLQTLMSEVLDPLRDMFGAPIVVTSGYRSPRLNVAVGGVKTSHHSRGMAADIVAKNGDNARLFELIAGRLPFTQLIWEKGDDRQPAWVHVAFDRNDLRREKLKTRDGKTYTRLA